MKHSIVFLLTILKLKKDPLILIPVSTHKCNITNSTSFLPKKSYFFETYLLSVNTKKRLPPIFLKKSLTSIKMVFYIKRKNKLTWLTKHRFFFFISRFLVSFLEFFFKNNIIFNIKKGSSRLLLKQVGFRRFYFKYFKKNLKTSRQIIGVLYYTLLLKDSSIFVNFFKKILEKLNIKLHKRLFKGLKKLIKDLFKPIFNLMGVLGIFFNIKGKIGVSGSAKKRRYFFYFGRHSLTSRSVKTDLKFLPIWTFTGTLGFTFLIFF